MAKVDRAKVNAKALKYNTALLEGARDVEFKGFKQSDLEAKITALEAKEQLRAQKKAEIDLLDDEIEDDYGDLNDTLIDIRSGVEGHKDFGDDHPLYGAMGHIRKSERRSGLHRTKKNGGTGGGGNT